MLVKATCRTRVWDSKNAREFIAGEVYELDTEENKDLLSLTTIPVSFDKDGNAIRYYRDNEGELKTIRIPKPPYAFEYDRNGTRTNEGVDVVKDYTCKKCGEKFKNLNTLGRHSYKEHRDEVPEEEEAETETVPA